MNENKLIEILQCIQLTNISLRYVSEFNSAESISCKTQCDPRIDWSVEVDG